jgi:hypothetical protein
MSARESFDRRDTPWQLVLRHVFDVALAYGEEDEAVAEVFAISHHNRRSIAAARGSCWAVLAAAPEDRPARKALALLDRTLREGDQRGCWRKVA